MIATTGLLLALAVPAPAAECTPRAEHARFAGLERLYFERIEGRVADHGSVARAVDPAALRALLPEKTPRVPHLRPFRPETTERELTAQDFRLPGTDGLLLRQVTDSSQRLAEQWWLLYDGPCRADAWYFVPQPSRTENKLLTEVRVDAVRMPGIGRLAFDVGGTMLRPGGAWWRMTATLAFTLSGAEITLERVAAYRRITRGYESEGQATSLTVTDERPVTRAGQAQVEIRRASSSRPAAGHACPVPPEDDGDSAAAVDAWVACALEAPEVGHRAADTPSALERGGKF